VHRHDEARRQLAHERDGARAADRRAGADGDQQHVDLADRLALFRPQRRLPRADLRVEVRREAGRDDLALPADVVVLTCQTEDGPQDLAMEPSTLTGFLSWVESAPGVR